MAGLGSARAKGENKSPPPRVRARRERTDAPGLGKVSKAARQLAHSARPLACLCAEEAAELLNSAAGKRREPELIWEKIREPTNSGGERAKCGSDDELDLKDLVLKQASGHSSGSSSSNTGDKPTPMIMPCV
ncbi:uncharacterized protein LOC140705785 [Pogona vitticeps]